jgi:hypothetical protein
LGNWIRRFEPSAHKNQNESVTKRAAGTWAASWWKPTSAGKTRFASSECPSRSSDWQNPKLGEHTQLPHETQFVNRVPFFDDFPIDDSEDGDALDFESLAGRGKTVSGTGIRSAACPLNSNEVIRQPDCVLSLIKPDSRPTLHRKSKALLGCALD